MRLGHYWQVASVSGKVPNPKKRKAKASRDSAMRGVYLHMSAYILHTFQSVNPPHGQWPAPMGSCNIMYICIYYIMYVI